VFHAQPGRVVRPGGGVAGGVVGAVVRGVIARAQFPAAVVECVRGVERWPGGPRQLAAGVCAARAAGGTGRYLVVAVDSTPYPRPYAHTAPDRTQVYRTQVHA